MLDPRSAVRIVTQLAAFRSPKLSHLSVEATDALFPSVPPPSGATGGATAGDAEAAGDESAPPAREPPSNQRVHDQFVLSRLEAFIEGAAFSQPVATFAAEHAHKFRPITAEEEQPLHYQELYLAYEAVLEGALETFLADHRLTVATLLECVRRAHERSEPLRCVDMLLASAEYGAFVELMLDYKFDMHAAGREITPDSVLLAAPVTDGPRPPGGSPAATPVADLS